MTVHPGISSRHVFGTNIIIIRIDKGVVASVGLMLSVRNKLQLTSFFKEVAQGRCFQAQVNCSRLFEGTSKWNVSSI